MNHYFSQDPSSRHDLKEIATTLCGRKLRFLTDSGVFSKDGVDFGTRLLLETALIPPGSAVLDLGCGYGAMGITAALLNPTIHVTLVDVNLRALDLAATNATMNGVSNVTVRQSDGIANLVEQKFDVVLTNPPIRAGKEVVFSFYSGARSVLKNGGSLWVVIQKKQGAPSTEKKLRELFSSVELRARSKGYHIYQAVNKITLPT